MGTVSFPCQDHRVETKHVVRHQVDGVVQGYVAVHPREERIPRHVKRRCVHNGIVVNAVDGRTGGRYVDVGIDERIEGRVRVVRCAEHRTELDHAMVRARDGGGGPQPAEGRSAPEFLRVLPGPPCGHPAAAAFFKSTLTIALGFSQVLSPVRSL